MLASLVREAYKDGLLFVYTLGIVSFQASLLITEFKNLFKRLVERGVC